MQGLEFISAPTPQLKSMVQNYRSTLPPEQFLTLLADIKSTYLKFFSALAAFEPGTERARMGHRLLTPLIDRGTIQVKPSCAKGCGTCCNYEVEITKEEGELLAQVVNDGFLIDRERLAIQASRKRQSDEWKKGSKDPENTCVFLGADQSCQVYEVRPSICRKHVVTSDPAECDKMDGKITPILIPLAEIALSAIISQPENPKSSLSKMLTLALNKAELNSSVESETEISTFFSDSIISNPKPEKAEIF